MGESSKAIESLFNEIKERASCGHNVILHIDDIDSLLSTRYMGNESSGVRRAVNTFITQLDELVLSDLPKMPIIAATTNMIDQLDSAVKRRFSLKLNFTPILNNEVLKTIMEPILEIMNSKLNINYLALEKIVIEKKLTPNDLILAMQNAYLNHLIGISIDEKDLVKYISEIESSEKTFQLQRESFSKLKVVGND